MKNCTTLNKLLLKLVFENAWWFSSIKYLLVQNAIALAVVNVTLYEPLVRVCVCVYVRLLGFKSRSSAKGFNNVDLIDL